MTVQQASYTVQYVEWTGENGSEVEEFLGDDFVSLIPSLEQVILLADDEEMVAEKGDVIIRATDGGHYRLPKDVLEKTYTPDEPWTWRLTKIQGRADINLQIDPALTEGLTGEEIQDLVNSIAEVIVKAGARLFFGPGQRIND